MDTVSYSHSVKQSKRIENFIGEPDSSSGLLSLPKRIATGENITIPTGRIVVHPDLTVNGTLEIANDGELFVPAGGTLVSSDLMHPVDTIADLRLENGQFTYVYVTGYHTKDDGAFGSNMFVWDEDSTETDNGGTIIKCTTVANGRYKLKYSGAVSVKWFGAVGDGVTDDTIAIQSAVLVNKDMGVSVDFIASDSYLITDHIYIVKNSIINGNNCYMVGNNNSNDCFRTAYYKNNILTDVSLEPIDTTFLYDVTIKKFRFKYFNTALRITSLTLNCLIEDVFSVYCTRHIKSVSSYFLTIRRSRADYCGTQTTGVAVADRVPAYAFGSLNGAMTFDNVSASSTQLGFALDSLQATDLSHLDCESVDVGIRVTGNIQNSKISSGYFENVGTIIYTVGCIVEGLDFHNNFCNNITTSIINIGSSRVDRYNDFSNQKINVVADSIGVPQRNGVSTVNTPKYLTEINDYPADNTPNGVSTNTNINFYGKSGVDTRFIPLLYSGDGQVIAKAISYEGGIIPAVYYGETPRRINNIIPFCEHSAVSQLGDFSFTVKIKTSIKFNELCLTAFSLRLDNEHTAGYFKGILGGTNILTSYKTSNFPNVSIVASVENDVLVLSLVGILNASHSLTYLVSGVIKII